MAMQSIKRANQHEKMNNSKTISKIQSKFEKMVKITTGNTAANGSRTVISKTR